MHLMVHEGIDENLKFRIFLWVETVEALDLAIACAEPIEYNFSEITNILQIILEGIGSNKKSTMVQSLNLLKVIMKKSSNFELNYIYKEHIEIMNTLQFKALQYIN